MEHLTKLFKLVELTKNQPMSGYAVSGLAKEQLDHLAPHHYLVAFIAWQLARNVNRAGANVNIEKVLEFAMLHDLGELFGGDISMHYGNVNPKARKKAKEFERENQKFLSRFFGTDKNHVSRVMEEILSAKSDEALIAKLADYMESVHYLFLIGRASAKIIGINGEKLEGFAAKIKDEIAKKELVKFIKTWQKDIFKQDTLDIIYGK